MYSEMKPLTRARVHSRLLDVKLGGIAELTLIAYLLHFFEHVVAGVLAWREMFWDCRHWI